MASWLAGLVGSSRPSLPFTERVGETPAEAWGAWTHCRGTFKDGEEVSVFKLVGASASDPKLVAARNGVKRLRTLRHPLLLQYKDSVELEADKGGAVTLYLVTEAVQPLATLLQELQLQGSQRDEYIAFGLGQVAQAVAFLNVDAKMVHGNVCMAAVVVTERLDWRLHALDLTSEVTPEQPPEALRTHGFLVADQYKPEEVRKGAWDSLRGAPPWAVDAWGVGCFIQEIFSGRKLSRTEELRELARVPEPLHKSYQRLLGSTPSKRLNPASLLESAFFQNKLVDTIGFLEKLTLKDGADKESFFRRLNGTLDRLPPAVVQRKVLPLIAAGLEFGSAPSAALPALLHAARGLPPPALAAAILPPILRLYASPDRATRVALLQHLDAYVELVSAAQMETLFEHLAAGFGDGTAFLRELSLKSLLVVAPKLSARTLGSGVLKALARLQVDEEPAIRANTTICLGNLARLLPPAACKRVLLNAFTRALRDPFPPARVAGLQAMQATLVHYDAAEGATRVLPAVAPLTVDADRAVRAAAFDLLDAFTSLLRAHHDARSDATEAEAAAAVARPLLGAAEVPAASGGAGGLLSWAVGGMGALAAVVGSPPALTPDKAPRPPGASPAPSPAPAASPAPPSEGWGGGEDDDFGVDPAEAAARARLSAPRGLSAPAVVPQPAADGGGWGLDDDDPLEDLHAPPPPPPPATFVPPPRPAAQRPVAAAPRPAKPAAMKLGASKLGASKLTGAGLDLEALLND